MEIKKSVGEFAVSVLPVAFLYFIGWGYLSFYLSSFGINTSEITLDLQTIFVYSYTPFEILFSNHPWYSGLFLALYVILSIFVFKRLANKQPSSICGFCKKRTYESNEGSERVDLPFYVIVANYCVIILTLFTVALIPVQYSASVKSRYIWDHGGLFTDPFPNIGESKSAAMWTESYETCRARRALLIVFAAAEKTYVLCRGALDQTQGTVFELRGEKGLASVRSVSEEGIQ